MTVVPGGRCASRNATPAIGELATTSLSTTTVPGATAEAILRYLERHPEYAAGQGGARRFLTTGKPGPQNGLVATFWGDPLRFEAA